MNEPKIRFQGFEREWKSGKIEEVAALQGGYAFQSSSFCKDGVPIVRIANILHSGEIEGKPYKLPIDEGQVRFAAEDGVTSKSVWIRHRSSLV